MAAGSQILVRAAHESVVHARSSTKPHREALRIATYVTVFSFLAMDNKLVGSVLVGGAK